MKIGRKNILLITIISIFFAILCCRATFGFVGKKTASAETTATVYDIAELGSDTLTLAEEGPTAMVAVPSSTGTGITFKTTLPTIDPNKQIRFGMFNTSATNIWDNGYIFRITSRWNSEAGGYGDWDIHFSICDGDDPLATAEMLGVTGTEYTFKLYEENGSVYAEINDAATTETISCTASKQLGTYFSSYNDLDLDPISLYSTTALSYDTATVQDISVFGKDSFDGETAKDSVFGSLGESGLNMGIKFCLTTPAQSGVVKIGLFKTANTTWGGATNGYILQYNASASTVQLCDGDNNTLGSAVSIAAALSHNVEASVVKSYKEGSASGHKLFLKIDGTETLTYQSATIDVGGIIAGYGDGTSYVLSTTLVAPTYDEAVVHDVSVFGKDVYEGVAGDNTAFGTFDGVNAGLKFKLSTPVQSGIVKIGLFKLTNNTWGGATDGYILQYNAGASTMQLYNGDNVALTDAVTIETALTHEVEFYAVKRYVGGVESGHKIVVNVDGSEVASYSNETIELGGIFVAYGDGTAYTFETLNEVDPVFDLNVSVLNGSVSGHTGLTAGQSATLVFTGEEGYALKSVTVDGVDVTANVVYGQLVLENVQKTTRVTAVFDKAEITYGEAQIYDITDLTGKFSQTIKEDGNALCSFADGTQITNVGVKFRWKAAESGFDGQVKIGIFKDSEVNVWDQKGFIIWIPGSGRSFNLLACLNGNAETQTGLNDIDLTDVWDKGKLVFEISIVDQYADGEKTGYVLKIAVNGVTKVEYSTTEGATALGGSFGIYNEASRFEVTSSSVETFDVNVSVTNATVSGHIQKETGETVELTVTPDDGYYIKSVKRGDQEIVINADGKYVVENIQPYDEIVVTTEEIKTVFTLDVVTEHGAVSGNTDLAEGATAVLVFTPDDGYYVKSVVYNGEDVTSQLVNGVLTLVNVAASDTLDVEFAEIVVTYGETEIKDFYDISGLSTKELVQKKGNALGELDIEARNAGVKYVVQVPADGFSANAKLGLYKTNADNVWAQSGYILWLIGGTQTVTLLQYTQENVETKAVENIDLSDVWNGGELVLEVGVLTKYENGAPAAYTLTLKVNEKVKAVWESNEETTPLGNYFNAYSEASGYTVKTTKEMTVLNVQVTNGIAKGTEYIVGTSPVITLVPDEKTFLKSATLNGKDIAADIVAVGGAYEYRTNKPTADDVIEIVFEKGGFETANVNDFYAITGMVSMEFTETMDNYGLGYITKTGNDAILMKVTLADNWNGRSKIGVFKSEGAGDIWALLGITVEIRSDGKFYLYTPTETELDSVAHDKVAAGSTFLLEIGVVKYMGDGEHKANYYYVKVDGVEAMYYLDYSKAPYGTKIMLPMLENEFSYFTLASAYDYYTVSVNETEGLLLQSAFPVKAGDAEIVLPLETGYSITAVTANGENVSSALKRVNGGYVLSLNVSNDVVLSVATEKTAVSATFENIEKATVSVDRESVPTGGSAVYTIRPDSGYVLISAALNGVDVTKDVAFEKGVYTYVAKALVENVVLVVTVETKSYAVSVTAGEGGSVTPDKTSVAANGSVLLTVAAADGYQLKTVLVNGKAVSIGVDGTYTVENVYADVTVEALFEMIAQETPVDSSTKGDKGGCGSVAGFGAIGALLAVSLGFFVMKRKQEDR